MYLYADPHRYTLPRFAAKNFLDAIRAVKSFEPVSDQTDIKIDADNIIMAGNSQGGAVSLITLEIAPVYAPEIEFSLAIGIAPSSDSLSHLQTMVTYLNDNGSHGQIGLVSISFYAVAEEEGRLEEFDKIFHDRVNLRHLVSRECGPYLHEALKSVKFLDDFMRRASTNDWDGTVWRSWFNKRNLGNFKTKTPIIIINGGNDYIVGSIETDDLYSGLKSNGNDVDKVLSPEADHGNLSIFADYLIFKAIETGFFRKGISVTKKIDLSGFNNNGFTFRMESSSN